MIKEGDNEHAFAKFTPGLRGSINLVDPNNFVYVRNSKTAGRVFWKCCKFKAHNCPARASTYCPADDIEER